MKKITVLLAIAVTFLISARGQGFLNLNFESAYNLTNGPASGELVSVTNALPDWTAIAGGALANIDYVSNNFPGITTLVELEGGSLALDGDFSVGLYFGGSISQTGQVPVNAESLEFDASSSINLKVNLGGQNLSYTALSQGPDYTVYGANIPVTMEGQMETLSFGVQGTPGDTLLDDIQFSPTGTPEPSEYALLGLGTILLSLYHRRKKQRNRFS